MRAAIVIPVKNEVEGLDALLDSLVRQTGPDDGIIVTDAGSTDGTPQIVRSWSSRDARIRLLVAPGAFPGHGRNLAIEATDAPYIVQVDGGNFPQGDFVEKMLRPLLEDKADYVIGSCPPMPVIRRCWGAPVDFSLLYGAMLNRGGTEGQPFIRNLVRDVPIMLVAGGSCIAYRREFWEKARGYPEWLRRGEDLVFYTKVSQQNPRYQHVPDAVCLWQHGPEPRQFLRRLLSYAEIPMRTPRTIRLALRTIVYRLALICSVCGVLFFPHSWPIPLALWAFEYARQAMKSLRAYRRNTAGGDEFSWQGVVLLLLLEFPGTLCRVGGIVTALPHLKQRFRDYGPRVEAYLAGGSGRG